MKKILLILCLGVLIVSCGDGKGVELKEPKTNKKVEKENIQTEAYEVELSAGHYVVGADIPAGIYDITAIKGTGNVSSSNMFDGGINQVMGTQEDGVSTKEFKNLKLENSNIKIYIEDKILNENTGLYSLNNEISFSNITEEKASYDLKIDITDLVFLITGYFSIDDLVKLGEIDIKNKNIIKKLNKIFNKKNSYLYVFI